MKPPDASTHSGLTATKKPYLHIFISSGNIIRDKTSILNGPVGDGADWGQGEETEAQQIKGTR